MIKKFIITIIDFALLMQLCFASPSTSISIPNSFSPNTTISSSQMNSNFNEIQTKYNTHSHTDLTQLGTITTGTWQGSVIDEAYGGLGSNFSSTAQGNIFYFSAAGTISALAPGTSGQVLQTGGAGANPSWVNGSTGITTVGTIATGTWQGTAIASGYIANSAITQGKLATTTGEVSTASSADLTLPGGTYGFYPQTKASTGNLLVYIGQGNPYGTSYATYIGIQVGGGATGSAQQRYVTSSGQDHWLFLLIDKITKDIIGLYSAPDAPHYGNGGDYNKIPHPFGNYNSETQEIVLVDKDTIAELKSKVTEDRSLATIVNEEYCIDKDKVYVPLHSGKYINKEGKQVMEMIEQLAPYIKVKSLKKMTSEELINKENRKQQAEILRQQELQQKKNKLKTLQQKLNLSDEELSLLKGEIR